MKKRILGSENNRSDVIYVDYEIAQYIKDASKNIIGELPGGGNQVFIPNVESWWFK